MNFTTILFILGIVLTFCGANAMLKRWWFVGSCEVTMGKVINLNPHRGSKGGTLYTPEVSFVSRNGVTGTCKADFSTSNPGLRINQLIRVAYNPLDVSKSKILTFGYCFGLSWTFFCIGLFLLLLCGGITIGNVWIKQHWPIETLR